MQDRKAIDRQHQRLRRPALAVGAPTIAIEPIWPIRHRWMRVRLVDADQGGASGQHLDLGIRRRAAGPPRVCAAGRGGTAYSKPSKNSPSWQDSTRTSSTYQPCGTVPVEVSVIARKRKRTFCPANGERSKLPVL